MASAFSLFGVILWSLAVFRLLGETLGTLLSHRSEVLSSYVECLLRASHAYVGAAFFQQPLPHGQQLFGHTTKCANLFAPLPSFDDRHTCHHHVAMHIQPTATRIEDFHGFLSFRKLLSRETTLV